MPLFQLTNIRALVYFSVVVAQNMLETSPALPNIIDKKSEPSGGKDEAGVGKCVLSCKTIFSGCFLSPARDF